MGFRCMGVPSEYNLDEFFTEENNDQTTSKDPLEWFQAFVDFVEHNHINIYNEALVMQMMKNKKIK